MSPLSNGLLFPILLLLLFFFISEDNWDKVCLPDTKLVEKDGRCFGCALCSLSVTLPPSASFCLLRSLRLAPTCIVLIDDEILRKHSRRETPASRGGPQKSGTEFKSSKKKNIKQIVLNGISQSSLFCSHLAVEISWKRASLRPPPDIKSILRRSTVSPSGAEKHALGL